jgi:hypothetical protein
MAETKKGDALLKRQKFLDTAFSIQAEGSGSTIAEKSEVKKSLIKQR